MQTVPLAHEAWGEERGTPLLLVHGYPFSRALWSPVLPALSKSVRAVAPDLRGFGASPAGQATPTVEDYARDLLALADALGHRTFDLVAHSMGGYVAFALLRAAPERVRRLVLVTTKATPDSDEAKEGRRRQAELAERAGPRAVAEALVPRLLAPGASPMLAEEARRIVEGTGVTGIAHALAAMAARPDATGLLPHVRAPTLVVAGGEDRLMPRAEQDRIAREVPGARMEVLARSGHLPMIEEPERFVEVVLGHVA